MNRSVRMKDIAVAAGVSVATVSRALQNHPWIAPATRERVQKIARDLGYRPNPLIGTLMEQIRSGRHSSTANLACLHGESHSSDPFQAQQEFLDGVREEARSMNYNIDFFKCASPAPASEEFARIWKARNIRGVILSNISSSSPLNFPWNDFAWVVNSRLTGAPMLHRVGNAIYQVLKRAVQEAMQRGYRKPGLVLRLQGEFRAGFRWPAAFLGNLLRYGLQPSVDQVFQDEWTRAAFERWFRKQRPDCIFALVDEPKEWLESMKLKIPEDAGFLHLAANISKKGTSGIVQDFRAVGGAAIHVLDRELRHNEIGIPVAPTVFTLTGGWREGNTLRPKPPDGGA